MLQIGRAIISFDILQKKFICNLQACKGACCVEGDSGAPLNDDEALILEEVYPIVEKYMTKEGIKAIKKHGKWVIDSDGDMVTPLVKNRECAYLYTDENNILTCAIETAYRNGEIAFKKPISCHLYPIRITEYQDFDALNYESNNLCTDACILGEKHGVEIYKFVKEPLIRKYGEKWYEELEIAVKELQLDKCPV